MKIFFREAFGYAVVSGISLIVDLTLLWILVHYCGWWYLAAGTASFLAGLAVTYALSVTWVFEYRRLEDPRLEFASFAAIGALGLVINLAVLKVAVRYLGLHYLIAKCAAAGCTFTWNFASRRQWLFVKPAEIRTGRGDYHG
ncbi:MAG TPA: GtrA family protein [Steroidobacteraceae bacterium]|nr:GtrA family protein [Steroidobacteraceae bacterium]